MFDHDEFERDFRRTKMIARVWFWFSALVTVVIIGVSVWAIISLTEDPAQIGRLFGEIASGYEETAP